MIPETKPGLRKSTTWTSGRFERHHETFLFVIPFTKNYTSITKNKFNASLSKRPNRLIVLWNVADLWQARISNNTFRHVALTCSSVWAEWWRHENVDILLWIAKHCGKTLTPPLDSTTGWCLDLSRHIFQFTTTENYNKGDIFVQVGVTEYDKSVGKERKLVKKSDYFPACNAVVTLKIEARPGCTWTKGCISARETKENKSIHF